MVLVKNFSIRKERGILRLSMVCSSAKFREKVVHLDIPMPQARALISGLERAIEKGYAEGNEASYIG